MKKLLSLLFVSLLFVGVVRAQHFLGYNYSNYQTAGGMVFNPASIAGSRYSVNVNLFSLNLGAINNGYQFKRKSIFDGSFDDLKEGVDFSKVNNSDRKNMFFNVDILGPSFMVDMGPKAGAIGLSSRVRFLANEKNLNNDIFQLFGETNSNYFGKLYTQDNLLVNAHGFADFGLTYARTIWHNEKHVIKGGVTGKYVLGIMGGAVRFDNLNVQINENPIGDDVVRTLKGDITALYSEGLSRATDDFDVEDSWDFAEKSNNFGLDLGVEYEWYRNGDRATPLNERSSWLSNAYTHYTLKASVSVTDIGKVKYTPSRNSRSYTINDLAADYPVSVLDLEDESLDSYLDYLQAEGIITPKAREGKYKIHLPTMLRANVDWNIYKRLYANAGASINLVGKNSYGGRYANYYYITPRYEAKWFSVYSPVSMNSLKQVNWGIGFNVGPLFVGSGSILSSLMSSNIKGADVHVGLSVPIFKRKAKAPKSVEPAQAPPKLDSDGDGIPDDIDQCPNEFGYAKYNGCPIPDSDGDGINDEEDECPNVPGLAKYKGCPIPDSDGDGINDEEDECPDVPGLARYKGCPIPDSDGDGVNDEEDECPNEPGPASNKGCPVIEQAVIQKVSMAAKQIFFASGSDKLLPKSYAALDAVLEVLQSHKSTKMDIEGHTDNTGNAASNQVLSEKRALAVKTYLVSKGIDDNRLISTGYGQTQPIADNKTAAGRTQNRRVEVKLHY